MQYSKNTHLIDANVILRYILTDNEQMAKKAREVILAGAYTKPEIIAEVVYVLSGVYLVPRDDIQKFVSSTLEDIGCEEKECVKNALGIYSKSSLDFVDCLLIAYHNINGEKIFTFDKKLNKYIDGLGTMS